MKFPDMDKPLPDHLEMIAVAIAKATHEFWLLDQTRRGWRPGLEMDEEKKIHPFLFGWKRLPKEVRDEYIKKARAQPYIINRAGFELILTAGGQLDIISKLIKNGGKLNGIRERGPREKAGASEPGPGRGEAVKPKESSAARGGTDSSGHKPGSDPVPEAGERGRSNGKGSTESPGEKTGG